MPRLKVTLRSMWTTPITWQRLIRGSLMKVNNLPLMTIKWESFTEPNRILQEVKPLPPGLNRREKFKLQQKLKDGKSTTVMRLRTTKILPKRPWRQRSIILLIKLRLPERHRSLLKSHPLLVPPPRALKCLRSNKLIEISTRALGSSILILIKEDTV